MPIEPYDWEFLRHWCLQCIGDVLERGRDEVNRHTGELSWQRLRATEPVIRDIVLTLADALNEPAGLLQSDLEQREFLLRYRDVLSRSLSPGDSAELLVQHGS